MASILLIATIQSWFFAFMVWNFKKSKELSDVLLMVWFLILGLHTVSFFFTHANGVNGLSSAFPFLQGPFLYLYISYKVQQRRRFRAVDWLHALPFLVFVAYQYYHFFQLGSGEPEHLHYIPFLSFQNPFSLLFITSLGLYIFLSYQLTRLSGPYLVWTRSLVFSLSIIWLSSMVIMFFPNVMSHQMQVTVDYLIFIVLVGFIYITSYFGLKENIFKTDIPRIGKPKYEKNALSESEIRIIWERLTTTMVKEEPFVNPDLKLTDLAQHLETSTNKLSQVINKQARMTFNDFVNSHRVDKAKAMMEDEAKRHLTLLAIAYDSGFSSKTTFNRAFKKMEGTTPSAYQRKCLEK